MDRIDIHIEVVPVPFDKLSEQRNAEKSDTIRQRVIKARKIQHERYKNINNIYSNAQVAPSLLRELCVLSPECTTLLKNAIEKLGLSARAYDRILKVSRTIADLDSREEIQPVHMAEAIQYRSLDRESWAG